MSQILEEQMSAFLDGELPPEEVELLLARIDREPERRATLARYAMVGECVRSGSASVQALVVAEQVRAALIAEETSGKAVTFAASGARRGWMTGGIAAAAVVVALLIAGPDAWRPDTGTASDLGSISLDAADESLPAIQTFANYRLNPRAAARLTGYLVAHGQYANQLSRSTFDSHLVSARAERANWRQFQDADDGR